MSLIGQIFDSKLVCLFAELESAFQSRNCSLFDLLAVLGTDVQLFRLLPDGARAFTSLRIAFVCFHVIQFAILVAVILVAAILVAAILVAVILVAVAVLVAVILVAVVLVAVAVLAVAVLFLTLTILSLDPPFGSCVVFSIFVGFRFCRIGSVFVDWLLLLLVYEYPADN